MEYNTFRRNTDLAANFTVRLIGTGYKVIEPLDTSLQLLGMLGSTSVKLIDMEANDGKYANLIMKLKAQLLCQSCCKSLHLSKCSCTLILHGQIDGKIKTTTKNTMTTNFIYLHENRYITNTNYLQIAKLIEAGSMETYHLHQILY